MVKKKNQEWIKTIKNLNKYLKKNKLWERFITPIVTLFILIILSMIIQFTTAKFILWLETLGLFLLTIGAIFAIRPVIRSILNPRLKLEESKEMRNINAGLISFFYILVGFAMQLTTKICEILEKNNFGFKYSWEIISLLIIIISYILFVQTLKSLKVI